MGWLSNLFGSKEGPSKSIGLWEDPKQAEQNKSVYGQFVALNQKLQSTLQAQENLGAASERNKQALLKEGRGI